jgi:hypothetical protein
MSGRWWRAGATLLLIAAAAPGANALESREARGADLAAHVAAVPSRDDTGASAVPVGMPAAADSGAVPGPSRARPRPVSTTPT